MFSKNHLFHKAIIQNSVVLYIYFCNRFAVQNFITRQATEMNLVIDIGNTYIKTGIFEEKKIISHQKLQRKDFVKFLQQLKTEYPKIENAMVSHVGKMEAEWGKFLQKEFSIVEFSAHTKLPFKNTYQTPETLGLDRIALMAAAFEKYPHKNVLVIDAGTCITYDFLDKTGKYHGGAISPGLNMRFMALNTFTDRLPLLSPENSAAFLSNFLGKSTFESIQVGVQRGVLQEIWGFIEAYDKKFRDLTVILTGGDAQILFKSIKNTIFAPSYFLLEGLNSILEFNKFK